MWCAVEKFTAHFFCKKVCGFGKVLYLCIASQATNIYKFRALKKKLKFSKPLAYHRLGLFLFQ